MFRVPLCGRRLGLLSGTVKGAGRLASGSPGYTLAETLAALAVLSLAIGGFSTALQVLSRFQSTVSLGVSRAQAERAAQVSLDRQFEGRGPFRSVEPEQFSGDEAGFQYACGRTEPCSVRLQNEGAGLRLLVDDSHGAPRSLPLRQAGSARFEYAGSRGTTPTWPPEGPERDILRSISLLKGGDAADPAPILQTRLWTEQPGVCVLDVVLQDCVAS